MNDQEHTKTGAWALNALDADEREQMHRYLAADPEAASEARAFEETAGELAGSLTPLAPRPELKAAVMARIATTRQLSPLPEEEPESADSSKPAEHLGPTEHTPPTEHPRQAQPSEPAESPGTTEGSGTTEQVVSLDRYRASVRRSRWTAVAAAALLLTTLAGVGLWSSERAAQQEMEATLAAMESQQAAAQQEREMLSGILAADDSAHLAVPVADGGSLELMYSREQQAMIVQPDGLQALPEGRAYQLWMIDDDDVTSAGMLEDPDATMMHSGAIPQGVSIGVTVEPAGGSDQPTTEPIGLEVLS